MIKEQGRFQVPFLRDPNTGAELFESAAIVDYLNDVYTEYVQIYYLHHASATTATERLHDRPAALLHGVSMVGRKFFLLTQHRVVCSMPPYCIVKPWSLIWEPNADFDAE